LKRIEFAEPLYGSRKWQAYSEADLFVLPSYSENFGMTIAEALAAGTPVIVAKGAPWGEVETHQTGWWIDIGIEPLIACLEEAFAQTPAQLEAMGMRGRVWMETEFSWVKVGRMMAETYRWIVTGGKTPGWVREE
jgi:glycosyltransferase involved in cell wall biosynthesis